MFFGYRAVTRSYIVTRGYLEVPVRNRNLSLIAPRLMFRLKFALVVRAVGLQARRRSGNLQLLPTSVYIEIKIK
jgi:hypothetical protein